MDLILLHLVQIIHHPHRPLALTNQETGRIVKERAVHGMAEEILTVAKGLETRDGTTATKLQQLVAFVEVEVVEVVLLLLHHVLLLTLILILTLILLLTLTLILLLTLILTLILIISVMIRGNGMKVDTQIVIASGMNNNRKIAVVISDTQTHSGDRQQIELVAFAEEVMARGLILQQMKILKRSKQVLNDIHVLER